MEAVISQQRRVRLPQTEQASKEASDKADARKIRYGFSPSYRINLGALTGNRYVGYGEIFPRELYAFLEVHPTGINEDPARMDEDSEAELPAFKTRARLPRTCAEDVRSEADQRVFHVFSSLTGRDDGQEIWDAIYPLGVAAEVWAMTDKAIRGEVVPADIKAHLDAEGMEPPYIAEGHALKRFIQHLERDAAVLVLNAGFTGPTRASAEACLAEALEASQRALAHRFDRLTTTFGLIEQRKNSGIGKKQLDAVDWLHIKETGIERPEDKPAAAAAAQGREIGKELAEAGERSQNQLAQAVTTLAAGQAAMQEQIAQQNAIIIRLLEGQAGAKAQEGG